MGLLYCAYEGQQMDYQGVGMDYKSEENIRAR